MFIDYCIDMKRFLMIYIFLYKKLSLCHFNPGKSFIMVYPVGAGHGEIVPYDNQDHELGLNAGLASLAATGKTMNEDNDITNVQLVTLTQENVHHFVLEGCLKNPSQRKLSKIDLQCVLSTSSLIGSTVATGCEKLSLEISGSDLTHSADNHVVHFRVNLSKSAGYAEGSFITIKSHEACFEGDEDKEPQRPGSASRVHRALIGLGESLKRLGGKEPREKNKTILCGSAAAAGLRRQLEHEISSQRKDKDAVPQGNKDK